MFPAVRQNQSNDCPWICRDPQDVKSDKTDLGTIFHCDIERSIVDSPIPLPPPPSGTPLDKAKRMHNVAKLVEMIESLKLQREFVQFLNDQLIDYFAKDPYKRVFAGLPLQGRKSETRTQRNQRFTEAMQKLYQLYSQELRADALFNTCYAAFEKRRYKLIMENVDNRCAFKHVLKQLIHFDKDPAVAESAYKEMRVFSVIHELIYDIKYDLKYKQFTRKSFEKKLNLIYELPLGEFQYEETVIKTCSPFVIDREELARFLTLNIDKEVESMLLTMVKLKKEVENAELRDYESYVGRFVHIEIEEAPIPSPSSSVSTVPWSEDAEANSQKSVYHCESRYKLTKEDQLAIREGFSKFYRRYTPNSPPSFGSKTNGEAGSRNSDNSSSIYSFTDSSSDSDTDSESVSKFKIQPASCPDVFPDIWDDSDDSDDEEYSDEEETDTTTLSSASDDYDYDSDFNFDFDIDFDLDPDACYTEYL